MERYEIDLHLSKIKMNEFCEALNGLVLDFGSPSKLIEFILAYVSEMIKNSTNDSPIVIFHIIGNGTDQKIASLRDLEDTNGCASDMIAFLNTTKSPSKMYISNGPKGCSYIDLYLFNDRSAKGTTLENQDVIQAKLVKIAPEDRYLVLLTSDDKKAFNLREYECKLTGYWPISKTDCFSDLNGWASNASSAMKNYANSLGDAIDKCFSSAKDIAKKIGEIDIKAINERINNLMKNTNNASNTIFGVPKIKRVMYNGPATIVEWHDGTKTVVKCTENDNFSYEVGLAMAISKKALGNNKSWYNYFNRQIKKAVSKMKGDEIK